MSHRDELEWYEATEAQDLTRLLRAVRPPAREVQVPPHVDLTIRAEIWQDPVRRQLITLLSMSRQELIQAIQQALMENPLLEAGARAEDEHASAGEEQSLRLTASVDDLTEVEERYDSIWQACVPDGWDANGLPSQADEAPGSYEHPSSSPEVLVPDVMVTKVGHDYQVCLNEEGLPRLRLSATYRRLVREGEAKQYLEGQLRAAVWLIRSLDHRRQTLLKVATSLVTWQHAFLEHGLAHLKPLVLTEVAEALGMHASTVSRVITNKYLYTEQGLFELKYFFHSGLESSGGETMSSLTVKDRIKQLVAAEDPAKPLTDQQLVEVLAAEHITIARRTVTTYRRELKLPPANRRQPHGATAGASRLSPDEEQRVRQALEAHAHRQHAELPPRRDREEASGVPPEDEEPWHRRDDEAAASRHQWFEKISGEVRAARRDLQTALAHPQLRPAVLLALQAFAQAAQAGATTPPPADAVEQGSPREIELVEQRKPLILLGLSEAEQSAQHLTHYGRWVEKISGEVRAARRDLQTALAHPQLRPAVLLALRAFAQAAQAGATTPPPADAVELVPRIPTRPDVQVTLERLALNEIGQALSSTHDLDQLLHLATGRAIALFDIEGAVIILLDEERQELYLASR
jgi:hypothetical protein